MSRCEGPAVEDRRALMIGNGESGSFREFVSAG